MDADMILVAQAFFFLGLLLLITDPRFQKILNPKRKPEWSTDIKPTRRLSGPRWNLPVKSYDE